MTFPYVVKLGDTIYRVIRKFSINITSFLQANPHLNEMDYLIPGQVIRIPIRMPQQYIVQEGDCLHRIAQLFQVSLESITSLNPGLEPRRLQAGQSLTLPLSERIDIVDCHAPYGYMELMRDLHQLKSTYPMIREEIIGNSVLGKPIPALFLGTGPVKLHCNGSFHANEWISSLVLMKFLEDLLRAHCAGRRMRGMDIQQLLGQVTLCFVPMVNPDGVELVQEGLHPNHPYYDDLMDMNQQYHRRFDRWKANIRGVDLNDQFPAHWEEEAARRAAEGPGPQDYGGEAPLTEPEAVMMAELAEREKFHCVLAFHSQGREIYWNYRGYEPASSEKFAERLARASGYKAVKLEGSDAGFKDWYLMKFGLPAFTIELGYGRNPLPLDQFPSIYEEASALLMEAMRLPLL